MTDHIAFSQQRISYITSARGRRHVGAHRTYPHSLLPPARLQHCLYFRYAYSFWSGNDDTGSRCAIVDSVGSGIDDIQSHCRIRVDNFAKGVRLKLEAFAILSIVMDPRGVTLTCYGPSRIGGNAALIRTQQVHGLFGRLILATIKAEEQLNGN